jgi:hypothetical protein
MLAEGLLPQHRPEEPKGLAEALHCNTQVVDSFFGTTAPGIGHLLQEVEEDAPQDFRRRARDRHASREPGELNRFGHAWKDTSWVRR